MYRKDPQAFEVSRAEGKEATVRTGPVHQSEIVGFFFEFTGHP